jgi:uncharacterized protein (DUF488 family)
VSRVVTIGVYGFTRERFLDALEAADVSLLLDVRDRRGVRGSDYAWANARRLEGALSEAGIPYSHRKDLATPPAIRAMQYTEDRRLGVSQRGRTSLAPEVRDRYRAEVLSAVDLAGLVDSLPDAGATALLCVEAEPAACHRSLIAERLADAHGVEIEHLVPY